MENRCVKDVIKHFISCLSIFATTCLITAVSSSCSNKSQDVIIGTRYYHPYGLELTPKKWEEQGKTGDVVEQFKSGVDVRWSYVDGKLHGTTTRSFPHSNVVCSFEEYENGQKISFGENYRNGSPKFQEENYPNGVRIIRNWYADGSPNLVEEWNQLDLIEGKYFNLNGDVEAVVQGGNGTRITRSTHSPDAILSREQFLGGKVVLLEEFYSNSTVRYSCTFKDGIKNGLSHFFAVDGQPVKIEHWSQGALDGTQIVFDHGLQSAHIPFKNGVKEGVEIRFKPGTDQIVAKITWHKDMRHGPSTFIFQDQELIDWYWKDGKVTKEQFEAKSTLYQSSTASQ